MSTTATRAHYFPSSKIKNENRTNRRGPKTNVTRTQGISVQKPYSVPLTTPRKALGDISNTAKFKEKKGETVHKPHIETSSERKVDVDSEKEYMPKYEQNTNSEFTTEFFPSVYFNNLVSAIRSTSMFPDIVEPNSVQLPSLTVDLERRPIRSLDSSNFDDTEDTEIDIPDIPDLL